MKTLDWRCLCLQSANQSVKIEGKLYTLDDAKEHFAPASVTVEARLWETLKLLKMQEISDADVAPATASD
jgi:hypothetical protein